MKNTILIAVILLVTFSCQYEHQHESHQDEAADAHKTKHDEHTTKSVAVTLNDGKRWIANPETTEGIANLRILVEKFPAEPEPADCRKLKTDMRREFVTILKKCTMKGMAHEQLHNYLLPMGDMVEKLDSTSMQTCTLNVRELKTYLSDYDKYFQ